MYPEMKLEELAIAIFSITVNNSFLSAVGKYQL